MTALPKGGMSVVEAVAAPKKSTSGRALIGIVTGLAIHYEEIKKTWNSCSSNLCRLERLTAYLTLIFGISRPAVIMTFVVRKLVNKMWFKLKGKVLLLHDSKWDSQLMVVAIYSGLEYALAAVWNWLQIAIECLKREDCDNDDILIWITNMKIRYCELTDKQELECDEDGESNCVPIENEDWCTVIFNELPLIMIGIVVGIFYVLLNQIDDNEEELGQEQPANEALSELPKKTEADPKSNDVPSKLHDQSNFLNTGNKEHDKQQDEEKNEQTTSDKSAPDTDDTQDKTSTNQDQQPQPQPYQPKPSNKKVSGQTKPKNEKRTGKPIPPKKKVRFSKSSKSKRKPKRKDKCPPYQKIQVYCPLCIENYIGCFPNPMIICCGDCCNGSKPDKPSKKDDSDSVSKSPEKIQESIQHNIEKKVQEEVKEKVKETIPSLPSSTNKKLSANCQDPDEPSVFLTFQRFSNAASGVLCGKLIAENAGVTSSSIFDNLSACSLMRTKQTEAAIDESDSDIPDDDELYKLFFDVFENNVEKIILQELEACENCKDLIQNDLQSNISQDSLEETIQAPENDSDTEQDFLYITQGTENFEIENEWVLE